MNRTDKLDERRLKRLQVLGWCEGASLLVLVFIAMPLKYAWGLPGTTRVVGMLHGLAFLMYAYAVADAWFARQLSAKRAAVALIASVVPGGTFVFNRTLSTRTPDPITGDQS
jgi:integral membrane protein